MLEVAPSATVNNNNQDKKINSKISKTKFDLTMMMIIVTMLMLKRQPQKNLDVVTRSNIFRFPSVPTSMIPPTTRTRNKTRNRSNRITSKVRRTINRAATTLTS